MTPEHVHRNLCALREMIQNAQETDFRRRRWAELLLGEDTANAMVEALEYAIIDAGTWLRVVAAPPPETPRGYTFPGPGQRAVRGKERNGK